MLNIYTVPCLLVDRVQKRNCYLSIRTLTSKNISGNLILVCFPLNMFFLPFSAILTRKCINYTYFAAVYTQIQKVHLISFFISAKTMTFTLHPLLSPSKHQSYLSSNLETSKYVRQNLFVVSLLLNTLFLLFFAV